MKYLVTLNGMDYEVEVNELSEAIVTNVAPSVNAPVAPIAAPAVSQPAAPVAAAPTITVTGGTDIVAPMPGTILSVNVSAGQEVHEGDVLFILEAMKMENEIVAPCDGKISGVMVQKGEVVSTDAILAAIGGTASAAPVAQAPVVAAPTPVAPVAQPTPVPVTPAPVAPGSGEAIEAPMPGTILSVNVSAGQAVQEGDVLFILEAMKMENEIVAPKAGTITQVMTTKGSVVSTDEALAYIG